MLKKIIIYIHSLFFKHFYGIKGGKSLYFGRNVHVKKSGYFQFGNNCKIRSNVDLFCNSLVVLDNADIGTRTRLDGCVKIGKNVLIGPDCYISSVDHNYKNVDVPISESGIIDKGSIEIGNDSWIGVHSVILGSVKIGKHSVIGANSVVTKNVGDYTVVAGSPAKIVRYYDNNKKVWIDVNE